MRETVWWSPAETRARDGANSEACEAARVQQHGGRYGCTHLQQVEPVEPHEVLHGAERELCLEGGSEDKGCHEQEGYAVASVVGNV